MNQLPNLIQRSLNLNREPNLSGSIIELKAIFRQEVYQAVIHHKALKPDDVGRYWLRQQFHNKILPPPQKKMNFFLDLPGARGAFSRVFPGPPPGALGCPGRAEPPRLGFSSIYIYIYILS